MTEDDRLIQCAFRLLTAVCLAGVALVVFWEFIKVMIR